jgi:hypothetical protein
MEEELSNEKALLRSEKVLRDGKVIRSAKKSSVIKEYYQYLNTCCIISVGFLRSLLMEVEKQPFELIHENLRTKTFNLVESLFYILRKAHNLLLNEDILKSLEEMLSPISFSPMYRLEVSLKDLETLELQNFRRLYNILPAIIDLTKDDVHVHIADYSLLVGVDMLYTTQSLITVRNEGSEKECSLEVYTTHVDYTIRNFVRDVIQSSSNKSVYRMSICELDGQYDLRLTKNKIIESYQNPTITDLLKKCQCDAKPIEAVEFMVFSINEVLKLPVANLEIVNNEMVVFTVKSWSDIKPIIKA